MNKIRVFHGTSYEQAENISKVGFMPQHSNWYVSDKDSVYFSYDLKDEEEAIRFAIEAGQISAALNHSQSTTISLFCFEIDKNEIAEYVDCSCENMDDIALEIPLKYLQNKPIKRIDYENQFVPNLGLLYLVGLSEDYLNVSRLSKQEKDMISSWNKVLNTSIWDMKSDLMYEIYN